MNKFSKVAVAAALAGAAASANAWWGPFGGFGDDFFGDGWFSFNFSFSASAGGRGWGRNADYYGPYGYPYWNGYLPAYGYPAAPALAPVLTEQQQAFAEQQAQALQQAVEAQRLFAEQRVQQHSRLAEQFREGVLDPLSRDPLAGFDPFSTDAVTDDRPAPGYVQQMIDQSDAAYEKAKADSQARREAFEKRVQERREAMQQRVRTSAPAPQEPPPASI